MANKLITLEELELCVNDQKNAGNSITTYILGNAGSPTRYYKLFSVTYSDTWANDRFIFSYASRHSGNGFFILCIDFQGDLGTANFFDLRAIRSGSSMWAPNGLHFFYNTSTHELSCYNGSNDWNTLSLRLLSKRSKMKINYYENPVELMEIPSDVGVELTWHDALFDDTLEKASTSEIQSIFGGGLISRLFTKLTEVVIYA